MTHLPLVPKTGINMVKGGRNAPVQVKLTDAERAMVKDMAAMRRGLTISEYVRALINLDARGAVDWKRADAATLAKGDTRLPDDSAPMPKPKRKRAPKRKARVAAAPPKGFV